MTQKLIDEKTYFYQYVYVRVGVYVYKILWNTQDLSEKKKCLFIFLYANGLLKHKNA